MRKKKLPIIQTLQLEYLFDYDVDLKNRSILLNEAIDSDAFKLVDAGLSQLEAMSNKPVTIKINSEGGSVYDALAIVGRMKKSKLTITTEGYGQVMSAACLILAAGDIRTMSKYAWFMWHELTATVSGTTSDLRNEVAQLSKEQEFWAQHMSDFTKKSDDYWRTIGKKDTYISASDCLKLKIIDKLF